MNGLRSFIEANTEHTEEELAQLTYGELIDIATDEIGDTDLALDEHDFEPEQ